METVQQVDTEGLFKASGRDEETDELIKSVIEISEPLLKADILNMEKIRPAKLISAISNIAYAYKDALRSDFSKSKYSIKECMESGSHWDWTDLTDAEKDKVSEVLGKVKNVLTAKVAKELLESIERLVRDGLVKKNEPSLAKLVKQLSSALSGIKSTLKKGLEEVDLLKANPEEPKKPMEAEMEKNPDLKKSVAILHKAIEAQHPLNSIYQVPNRGFGTVVKSENGVLLIAMQDNEKYQVNLNKGVPKPFPISQRQFADALANSPDRHADKNFLNTSPSAYSGDVTAVSPSAEKAYNAVNGMGGA